MVTPTITEIRFIGGCDGSSSFNFYFLVLIAQSRLSSLLSLHTGDMARFALDAQCRLRDSGRKIGLRELRSCELPVRILPGELVQQHVQSPPLEPAEQKSV